MIARELPGSLQLAFVGDTVYDLFVRERLVRAGGRMDDLHRAAVRYVCAAAQSAALARVEPLLTEEEAAVIGALYLSGAAARLEELMEVATGNIEV